ncbi:MAG: hypothetical protein LN409_02135 [Candidatus Thermoplasmatota archaeon]|nr:hypothetical protein [Candidatus Thermoplasmatota archaeon]
MGSELSEVGEELGVERKDVKAIKRTRFKRLLFKRVFGWMAPLLAFVVGFFAGGALSEPSSTSVYPYAAATFVFNYKAFTAKTKFTILGTAILSTVVFVLGFVLGGDTPMRDDSIVPMYTVSPEYGVFHIREMVT